MNNFINENFPEDIGVGAVGGPEYKTDIALTASGREFRNVSWSMARLRYNVAYGIKNRKQMEHLLAFFRVVKGKAIGFRFKDWSDYRAMNSIIGYGDGQKSSFQLVKNYQSGGLIESRVITKPTRKKVQITINGNILSSESYKIDYNKGIVEFLFPPTTDHEIRATFDFDVPVRFDIDYLPITFEDINLYSCHNISLIEIKS